MNDFYKFSTGQKSEIIRQVVNRTGLYPQIIEKDLWVTNILQLIFSFPFAGKLVFKVEY